MLDMYITALILELIMGLVALGFGIYFIIEKDSFGIVYCLLGIALMVIFCVSTVSDINTYFEQAEIDKERVEMQNKQVETVTTKLKQGYDVWIDGAIVDGETYSISAIVSSDFTIYDDDHIIAINNPDKVCEYKPKNIVAEPENNEPDDDTLLTSPITGEPYENNN